MGKLKRITRCILLGYIDVLLGYIDEFTQVTLKVLVFRKREMKYLNIFLVLSPTEITIFTSPFMK